MPHSMEERVARLERSAARWRSFGVAALAVAGLVAWLRVPAAVAAPTDPEFETVKAKRFELVDKSGKAWAVLGRDQGLGVTSLAFLGTKDVGVLGLRVNQDFPQLTPSTADGRSCAVMEVEPGGLPSLRLFDPQSVLRVVLTAGDHLRPGGGGGWLSFGREKDSRVLLGVEGDDMPHLEVLGSDGKPIWKGPSK